MPNHVPPGTVDSLDRRTQALALRRRRMTYEQVGDVMGITKQAAHSLVMKAIEERRTQLGEHVDAVRELELDMLDHQERILIARLEDPRNRDVEKTSGAILRVMERRAKLLGLDAPTRVEASDLTAGAPPQESDIDLTKLSLEQLRQLENIVVTGRRTSEIPTPPQTALLVAGCSP